MFGICKERKPELGKTFSFTYTKASTQLLDLKQALKLIHVGSYGTDLLMQKSTKENIIKIFEMDGFTWMEMGAIFSLL